MDAVLVEFPAALSTAASRGHHRSREWHWRRRCKQRFRQGGGNSSGGFELPQAVESVEELALELESAQAAESVEESGLELELRLGGGVGRGFGKGGIIKRGGVVGGYGQGLAKGGAFGRGSGFGWSAGGGPGKGFGKGGEFGRG